MPVPRRLWDSSVVVGYLAGYESLKPNCPKIISQAQRGELEIIVSTIATIEAAYLQGHSDEDSEDRIQEFFSRDYIIPVAIDARIASIARSLVRKYRGDRGIKPPDAAHFATALQWDIPVIETTDNGFLRFDGLEGNPPIKIRHPLYEGTQRLTGL